MENSVDFSYLSPFKNLLLDGRNVAITVWKLLIFIMPRGYFLSLMIPFALWLAGCSPKTDPSDLTKGQPEIGGKLVILNWPDYLAEEVIREFKKETGVAIQVVEKRSLGQETSFLRSAPQNYDILIADHMVVQELMEIKVIQPIDKRRLANFNNLEPRYLNQPFDPGNLYSLPYTAGATIIAYRKDQIQDPPKSWSLLWDSALRGKIGMMEEREDVYHAVLCSLHYPVQSDRPEELHKCTERLLAQVDLVAPKYADSTAIKEMLEKGQCAAALVWNNDASLLAQTCKEVAYFVPEEGAPLWFDSLVISREAPNLEAAYKFLDFIMRPKIAALNANSLRMTTPVAAARDMLDEDLRNDRGLYPSEELMKRCQVVAKSSPQRIRITNEGMKRVMEKVRGTDQDKVSETVLRSEAP